MTLVEYNYYAQRSPGCLRLLSDVSTRYLAIIVTHNLTDFDAHALAPWEIKAFSPDEFLSHLFDDYPEEMVEVVRQQAQKYKRRPLTFVELLTLLSKKDGANLQQFVNKVISSISDDVV